MAKDRVERQGPCAPPPFFLHNYYHLQAFTSWNKVSIDKFVILIGVQQGSVLSPHLFFLFFVLLLYIEYFIKIMVKRNIGCEVGDHFTGILVYICRRYSVACAMASNPTAGG